jgi:hypothetical protein
LLAARSVNLRPKTIQRRTKRTWWPAKAWRVRRVQNALADAPLTEAQRRVVQDALQAVLNEPGFQVRKDGGGKRRLSVQPTFSERVRSERYVFSTGGGKRVIIAIERHTDMSNSYSWLDRDLTFRNRMVSIPPVRIEVGGFGTGKHLSLRTC